MSVGHSFCQVNENKFRIITNNIERRKQLKEAIMIQKTMLMF